MATIFDILGGYNDYDRFSATERVREGELLSQVAAARARLAGTPAIDVSQYLPEVLPYSPMAQFAASLTSNVASAVSGNQNYQRQTAGAIAEQEGAARQSQRERGLAALENARATRAEQLSLDVEMLSDLRERARTAGNAAAQSHFAGLADKRTRELQKLAQEHELTLEGNRAKHEMERQKAADAAALKRAELANKPTPITGNETIDSILRLSDLKRKFRASFEEEWQTALKNKTSKAKTLEQFMQQNPKLQQDFKVLEDSLMPIISKPIEMNGVRETAANWFRRLQMSGVPVEQITEMGKTLYPGDTFTPEPATVTSAGNKSRAGRAVSAGLKKYGEVSSKTPFPWGSYIPALGMTAPEAFDYWFLPVPDSAITSRPSGGGGKY